MGKYRRNAPSGAGSQPAQLKIRRRKRHIAPLNSKGVRGKRYFSVGCSVLPISGDNIECSMQTSENILRKRGFEPGKEEKEAGRNELLLKSPKHTKKGTFSFSSSIVPFLGDSIDNSRIVPSEREKVYTNLKPSRRGRRRRRWKANFRLSIREDDLSAPVQVGQKAAEICKSPSHKSVDYALVDRKTAKRHCWRSGKQVKDNRSDTKHMSYSQNQPQLDISSSHSSLLRIPEKINDSDITDYIPLSSACKLTSSPEKDNKSLNNTVFDDSSNDFIPYTVNVDTTNHSDIRVPGKRRQKTKCSIIDVQENHSAQTACLPDSIIHEDKYDSSDLSLKVTGSLDEDIDVPHVLPERSLRITLRKKLLVLDLNGILCDVVFGTHGSHMPYKKVSMKSVFKRPFLDDFMSFCFERFAVGIWSSRNKKNIAGVIDYLMGDSKDRLLFCWDQSKCTLTGLNTIKNKYKPLVLKELIKLWNKEESTLPWEKGDYSPSNTLLVDDSPYKALCNPLNTGIFPFSYDFRDESDNFLGPGGALRVYLESIAMVDDVQVHVKEHSFGQLAITSEDENWSFYKNIIDKHNAMPLT